MDESIETGTALHRGREAFGRRAWRQAHAELTAADSVEPLEPADLERLAIAAHLVGRDDDAAAAWARTYQRAAARDDPARAVRAAFWIGMTLGQRGELSQAGGWLARAQHLIEESGRDIVEAGYLLVPPALHRLMTGDPAAAYAGFEQAGAIADRFGDVDLATLGRLGRGQSLVAMSETARGVGLLDEAMVAVVAGEASPMIAGLVYCAVIDACQSIFDLRRAQEWTAALTDWCATQPDLVPFRGQCLVYRAELLRFHGAWRDADVETRRARDWLTGPPLDPAVGEALYQQAELDRLRGSPGKAERAYREASRFGRRPEPGIALLRLAQGKPDAAWATIRRALDEADDAMTRWRLLEPAVEVALAVGDLATARAEADELAGIALRWGAPLLVAMAERADGTVTLAEGDARTALASLRRAWTHWQELDAPYEAARVRVQVGLACRALGDDDTAELEFDAARQVFRALGAAPDVRRVDALSTSVQSSPANRLSGRELEVLRLVAAGRTNREIAAELVISERTVDRHVSNLFVKLDVSTRSAATAYAYEHDLL